MHNRPIYIVPMESSSEMEETISAAVALASHQGATVDLLEIVRRQRPSYMDLHSRRSSSAMHEVSGHGETIRRSPLRDPGVRTVTHPGKAMEVIPAYAQLVGAELIVVGRNYGTKRSRRNTRFVSTLSRSAPVPVFVVPLEFRASARSLPFRQIVSAVDFTLASAVAVRTVLDMIRRTDARLTVVHALSTSRSPLAFSASQGLEVADQLESDVAIVADELRRRLPAECRFQIEARVKTGDADRAILDVATEVDADLIVMGVTPRTRLDEELFGSTLRSVLRRSRVPVLVLSVPSGAQQWLEAEENLSS